MLSIKKFTTTLMLGMALALTSAAFAQKAQSDPKQKESCCAMPSCCCKGDSCSMKEHKEHAKNHQAKEGCCCCGSDSCDMNLKDGKEKEDKPKSN